MGISPASALEDRTADRRGRSWLSLRICRHWPHSDILHHCGLTGRFVRPPLNLHAIRRGRLNGFIKSVSSGAYFFRVVGHVATPLIASSIRTGAAARMALGIYVHVQRG